MATELDLVYLGHLSFKKFLLGLLASKSNLDFLLNSNIVSPHQKESICKEHDIRPKIGCDDHMPKWGAWQGLHPLFLFFNCITENSSKKSAHGAFTSICLETSIQYTINLYPGPSFSSLRLLFQLEKLVSIQTCLPTRKPSPSTMMSPLKFAIND